MYNNLLDTRTAMSGHMIRNTWQKRSKPSLPTRSQ